MFLIHIFVHQKYVEINEHSEDENVHLLEIIVH